jgi:hypothetical protein
MNRKATQQEAQRFVEAFGINACAKAEEAAREAQRKRDARRTKFFTDVARHIQKKDGSERKSSGRP